MEQGTRDYIVAKTKEMIAVDYCCEEAKAAGEAFLKAAGTAEEDAQMKAYVAELKEDLLSIEELIAFAKSENAVKCFGEDDAREMLKHAEERKAAGEKFCDCEACAAAAAIIDRVEAN